MLKTMLFFAL